MPLWPVLQDVGVAGRGRVGSPLTGQGIAEIVTHQRRAHPHALHHSFAQIMERASTTVSTSQARPGHSNLAPMGRSLTQISKAENTHAEALARLFGAGDGVGVILSGC